MKYDFPDNEWDQEEEEEETTNETKTILSALELADMIEERIPTVDKKNKSEVNSLIDEYNNRFGKVYKRV